MFRSLLVPLDGSSEAEAALPMARTIAHATGGSITLLRVTSNSRSECDAANSYLEQVARELQHENVPAEAIVRSGQPTREILATARMLKAELIVMATHAPGPRSITILTSVARWVIANSPVPVVLVRPEATPTTRLRSLLVPLDGSPGASMALGPASVLARAAGARIILLQVVVPVPASAYAGLPGMTLGGCIDPAWEQAALNSARSYVDALARHLRDSGLTTDGHIALGDVATEISQCAAAVDADLVVMSTHTLHWPGDANVSSVADGALQRAKRPLLLIRREPPAGETEATAAALGAAWTPA